MRTVLLILCITCASYSTSSAPRAKRETIAGQIVAYLIPPACLNGNAYWSVLIRVRRPKDMTSELIRVDFSLPCDKSADWISAKPSIQKFRLFRQKDCDRALEGLISEKPNQSLALPIWLYPSDAEQVTLPFGQVVPCYRSVDLPLAPVV